ncbi:hypothetical protein SS37A_39660 (plasmid) [Methylocystis iwaonis]|uniref:Uncharacterized protein n=1 Tax=Methylocystis iwaonis TaxID=2885079 RepID=A0ABM8EEQ8_9HYPH|nr:hypothetical protein SS37A_39660 [Methylocystis iwaonis]
MSMSSTQASVVAAERQIGRWARPLKRKIKHAAVAALPLSFLPALLAGRGAAEYESTPISRLRGPDAASGARH